MKSKALTPDQQIAEWKAKGLIVQDSRSWKTAPAEQLPLTIDCPGLIVVSEANMRCHWAERRKRMAGQKDQLLLAILLGRHQRPLIENLTRITFTRIGGRKLDSDNLAGAFKGVRDALCGWLGIDDGDDVRLTFSYAQEKGVAGIRVEIKEV